MPTHVAFLRAINVGNRRVDSDDLAQLFVDLGFDEVDTYLASGNVIFDADETADALEPRIEVHLEEQLGYEVPAFLRSMPELRALLTESLFDDPAGDARTKRYVVFSKSPLSDRHRGALDGLATDVDRFAAQGRHIFWLRDLDAGESMSTGEVETALEVELTRRTMRTVERIVGKYG